MQLGETAEQAKQLAVEQAHTFALRVWPDGHEVHVVGEPEQVRQPVLHGRHEVPLR